jgi:hypothetical protein
MSGEKYREQKFEGYVEEFKATIQAGQAALKSAILINGGASVAILAFIGNLATSEKSKALIPILSCSLAYFVFGTLVAAMASGGAYLSQAAYSKVNQEETTEATERWKKRGKAFQYTTIIFVIASYILFGLGALLTYKTFLNVG